MKRFLLITAFLALSQTLTTPVQAGSLYEFFLKSKNNIQSIPETGSAILYWVDLGQGRSLGCEMGQLTKRRGKLEIDSTKSIFLPVGTVFKARVRTGGLETSDPYVLDVFPINRRTIHAVSSEVNFRITCSVMGIQPVALISPTQTHPVRIVDEVNEFKRFRTLIGLPFEITHVNSIQTKDI